MLVVGAGKFERGTHVETASILAIVIDEGVFKTEALFFAFGQDTYWCNDPFFDSYST